MKTKFSGFLTLLLALVVQIAFAQQKEISGTVTDDEGLPLPGVNITVKDSDTGTQTDFDGNYSLNVDEGAEITFTFVGFTDQTVTVGQQDSYDITLEEGETLDDVVVTGYKTTTDRRSSTAVSTVTSEDLKDKPNASAIDALQGKVAGLNIGSNTGQPGESGAIILRGVGSINGDIEPMFVIDGVPSSKNNFTNLNPNDIESVNVLKGASATSIYGNRGANGVVVVTTKSGSYDQKMEIEYRSQYGFSEIMPLNMEIMNSREKLTFQRDNEISNGIGYGMTDAEIDQYSNSINTYWGDYFFRTAQMNRHDLTINSGSENLSSSTSVNYLDQEGTFIASDLKRFGFRNRLNGKSENGKFNYSTNINMSYTQKNFTDRAGDNQVFFNPFLNSLQGSPLLSPFDPDGSVTSTGGLAHGDPAALTGRNAPYVLLNSAKHNTMLQEQMNIIAGAHADYEIVENLTAAVDVNMNLSSYQEQEIMHPNSLLGPFQVDDRADFGGIDREVYERDARFTTRANLGYSNTWDDKHSLDLNAYTEYIKNHLNSQGFSTRGLDSKFIGNDGAFNLQVKEDLGEGEEYLYVPSTSLSLGKISTGLFSYFGTADYDYDDRFGASASIRRDASMRFSGSNQWGTFWSAAGRWNIDAESWMENSSFNMLKLRAEYGTTGNERITSSFYGGLDLFQNMYDAGTGYNNTTSYIPSTIANPTLKWETTAQANVGIDFAIENNKLQGSLDVYQKDVKDLYQARPVSATLGTTEIDDNIGKMQNRGVELALQYNIVDSDDWRVDLRANGSYNKNKIKKLAGADEDGLVRTGGSTSNKEGQSIGEFFTVEYAGVNPANGNHLYYDKDGNLTESLNDADRKFNNKQIYPEINGGFGVDVHWKGFYFTQDWVYFANVYRMNQDLGSMEDAQNYAERNSAASLLNAWQEPGDITSIPRLNPSIDMSDNLNKSDQYLQDASYLRLRNVTFGYSFTEDQLNTLPVDGLTIYLQAENLLTFTKFKGYDPESSYTGAENTRYPSAKTYSVGLNVNF